jgi:hypothetical protein
MKNSPLEKYEIQVEAMKYPSNSPFSEGERERRDRGER